MQTKLTQNEDASQYEFIVKKLQKTLDTYRPNFPDLGFLQTELAKSMVLEDQKLSGIQKLEAVCNLLQQHTVASYTIRHLYHNFYQDVTFYRQGTPISDTAALYLETPYST